LTYYKNDYVVIFGEQDPWIGKVVSKSSGGSPVDVLWMEPKTKEHFTGKWVQYNSDPEEVDEDAIIGSVVFTKSGDLGVRSWKSVMAMYSDEVQKKKASQADGN
jgi:hypothetical protein